MKKLLRIKYWLAITIASLFVVIGYELRLENVLGGGIPSLITAVFSFLLGATFADLLCGYLLNQQFIRNVLLGVNSAEGYWYLTTDCSSEGESPLDYRAVLYIQYVPSKGEVKSVTIRYDKNDEKFITNSVVAYIREDDINVHYLNHFRLTYNLSKDDISHKLGIVYGEFSETTNSTPGLDRLEAHIAVSGEGIVRRQSADKIPNSEVSELKKEYGDDWIHEYLRSRKNTLDA